MDRAGAGHRAERRRGPRRPAIHPADRGRDGHGPGDGHLAADPAARRGRSRVVVRDDDRHAAPRGRALSRRARRRRVRPSRQRPRSAATGRARPRGAAGPAQQAVVVRLGLLRRVAVAEQLQDDVRHVVVVAAGEQPVVQRARDPDRDRRCPRHAGRAVTSTTGREVSKPTRLAAVDPHRAEAAGGRAEVEQVSRSLRRRGSSRCTERRVYSADARRPPARPRRSRATAAARRAPASSTRDRRGRAHLSGLVAEPAVLGDQPPARRRPSSPPRSSSSASSATVSRSTALGRCAGAATDRSSGEQRRLARRQRHA